jgi:glutamate synthase (NADPH/NADH) large chain
MCGGTIVMRTPGGGDAAPGGNVLIGNFALFGATGGRLFVAGEAGDRFAVRNSGATAVVEGVGDFGCEYMTNGAVVNLGSFGKGLGNGMSGGFLYQYDPSGDAARWMSHDSLVLGPVADVDFHERALHGLLTAHVEATGSVRAAHILENWESEREHFVYGMPRALLLYQDTEEILKGHSRKELLDELATALAAHQLRRYKLHFRDGEPVSGGAVPGYGDAGSEAMFALLNNYTVLSLAQNVAMLRVQGATGPEDPRVADATRKLLLTEDYAVATRIQRYAREAVDGYSDPDLAALISVKRVGDYKEALSRRNVLSVDAPGTYGWILHIDARNREALGRIPGFEELFAAQSVPDVAEMALKAGIQRTGAHA